MVASEPGYLDHRRSEDRVLLLLCPDEDTIQWSKVADEFSRQIFDTIDVIYWSRGDAFPEAVKAWEGDWIISFRCDLIIPPEIYSRAQIGAINWHPSPPHFRGLGGQYYAIFEGHEFYGTTCHHLAKSVDSGEIIDARMFSIAPGESTTQLRQHVGAESLSQYLDIVSRYVARGELLPRSVYTWGEHLYTAAELSEWLAMTREQSPDHLCLK